MIICPQCDHPNPVSATRCEHCLTNLASAPTCPACGTSIEGNEDHCPYCGLVLVPNPTEPMVSLASSDSLGAREQPVPLPPSRALALASSLVVAQVADDRQQDGPDLSSLDPVVEVSVDRLISPAPLVTSAPEIVDRATHLQVLRSYLLHQQTQQRLALPIDRSVLYIGKPNHRIPPDIDVSELPDAEIVSRVHATIKVEGDAYYVEDMGSSNGTYINQTLLPIGESHCLRTGDLLSLGKGDKVTFVFHAHLQ